MKKLVGFLIFVLLLVSIVLCSCSKLDEQDMSQAPTKTPVSLSFPAIFVADNATVTRTISSGTPCESQGKVTVTIRADNTVLMEVLAPDVIDADCKFTGDKVMDRFFGKFDARTASIDFSTCNTDMIALGYIQNVNPSAIQGVIGCHYIVDGKSYPVVEVNFVASAQAKK